MQSSQMRPTILGEHKMEHVSTYSVFGVQSELTKFLAIEYFNESFESVNSLFEYLTFTGETIYATWAHNNHEVICLNNAIDGI